MSPLKLVLLKIVLGSELQDLAIQYGFLLVVSSIEMLRVIKTRVGALDAVVIRSYPRLCLGVLVCNAIGLIIYHVLLLINPTENWRQFILYVIGFLLSYPIYGIGVTVPGWLIDHGEAMQVITSRYKKDDQPRWFIDLSEKRGEHAQFIPRGAIRAYQWFMFLSWLVISINLQPAK